AEGRRDAEQSAPGTRSWIGYGRRRPDVPGSSTRHWKAGCWRGISIQAGGRKATVRRGSVSESAPACDPLDADGDDRQPLELHGGELAVARLQQRLSPAVLVACRQDLRPPPQHHPGEPPPILVIVVEDEGRLRGFGVVAHPLPPPTPGAAPPNPRNRGRRRWPPAGFRGCCPAASAAGHLRAWACGRW